MFRGSGSRGGRQNLTTLASEEADAILRDVEELQEIGDGREVRVMSSRCASRSVKSL